MDASVTMENGMRLSGSADSGHEIVMDAGLAVGGNDSGPRPMELILTALCGCTAMDVISILRKKRQAISGLEVRAHADQNNAHPHVFTDIHLEYIVTGKDIDPKAVERSIKLSSDIYCPAQAMLGQVANMTSSYEIIEE